jgi:hypothetical protein
MFAIRNLAFIILCFLFFVFHFDAKVVGFYHVWSPNEIIPPHTIKILKEQIESMTNMHTFHRTLHLHVSLIGNSSSLPTTIKNFFTTFTTNTADMRRLPTITYSQTPSGFEPVTIKKIWDHCAIHPNDIVWYLHNKGSFHSSLANDHLRYLLLKNVLSAQCYNEIISRSDVCGMRFTEVPHRHFPGNMWIANCSYIKLLPDPTIGRGTPCQYSIPPRLGAKIGVDNYQSPCSEWTCLATGRFYIEHWIGYLIDGIMSDCLGDVKYESGENYQVLKDANSSFAKIGLRCQVFHRTPRGPHIFSVCAQINLTIDPKLYGTKAQPLQR